ncbi:PAS domain S-box protein [Pontibacter sp. H249]|uniref:PAS domain S-box protein n=1 Tax=Pontibacter sp. H249 TaxID=3133420 RepID=UPI0030BB673A
MQTSPENKYFIFSNTRDQVVKLVGVMFTVLATLLVGVGYVSFVGAREIEQNYSLHLSKTIHKLELLNQLHHNNDDLNKLLANIVSPQPFDKSYLVDEFKVAQAENTHLLQELKGLVSQKENKLIIDQLINYRRSYLQHTDSISALALEGRINGAALYKETHLTPVDHVQENYLNKLSNNLHKLVNQRDTQAAQLLSKFVKYQELLLVLVLLASGCAVFLMQYLFKKLKKENFDLSTEIKKREELQSELYKSQQIYKTLFDSNPIPMWIYDTDSLSIIKANTSATEEYGYTQEEFLDKKIHDIKLPDDLDDYLNTVIPKLNSHNSYYNVKHKRKDGSEFRVEIHSHALPEADDTRPRLVVAVNVDDQYNAIERIERSEEQLREISSSIPGAVYQFYVDKEGNFSFPFMSDGVTTLYGLTPDELYSDPNRIFEQIHPEDKESAFCSINESVASVKSWYVESRLWNPMENRWKWVRAHSLPTQKEDGSILFNGTLIDITLQKEAEEELSRKEANLKALLDSSNKAILLIDSEFKVLSFNTLASDFMLQLRQKVLKAGQNICDYIDKTLLPDLKEDLTIAMQGHEVTFETGSADSWYEIGYKPAISKDNQVLAVALNIHNITEQRTIIEAIRKSEAQLTKAQALTKLGSWEYDIEKSLLTTSDSLCEIYGLPGGATIYSSFEALFHPEDAGIASAHFQEAIKNQTGMTFDHRLLLENGKVKYLHTVGEIVFDKEGNAKTMAGATQDISELKLKEQELRDAKEKLQATLENIPEVIFTTDSDFNIIYVSPQVRRLTGYLEEELLGEAKSWRQLVHPDDIDQFVATVMPSVPKGNKLQYELRIVTKHHEIKWIVLRYSPVIDKKGNIIRVDGSAADITDKKQEEARGAVLNEQLQKQNNHLQQFAYIVSHNLRAQIANILGLTSIYDRRRPESTLNLRVIDNLSQSAKLLDGTIRDLNDILTIRSQLSEGNEIVNFHEMLAHILTSIADTLATEEADVICDFNEAPEVVTVRGYIYSIMLNLVTNALKYRSSSRKLELKLKTFKVLDYICLQVQDNGQGIDLEKERDKIFGLYKRFHHNKDGKGVGLYLVKTQAELLGGKVEVDSQPDLGSIFKVYLKHQL